MSAVRLIVRRTELGTDWRAHLETDRGPAVVGYFPTWADAIREGCVAGRLQAAGISWDSGPGAMLQPGDMGQLTGDGTGEALPPLPDDAYPPGAIDLEALPVDAVGRSLPGSLTFGQWREQQPEGRDGAR